jgi:hypothetical protein
MGEWRLVPVKANRMPAAASYLRRPGDTQFRASKFDVMRIEAGMIAEITTFSADLFPAFGLQLTMASGGSVSLQAREDPVPREAGRDNHAGTRPARLPGFYGPAGIL